MDLQSPNILYAAMYQRRRTPFGFNGGGPHSGLYKTIDGGANWKRVKGGLPETGETGRIGIDIYRKDPNIVYVLYEHAKGGVFRSEDKGESWTHMADTNPRPMYFSQIRIDPNNDQRIWMAGVTLFFSEDGGKTFRPNMSPSIHADFHAIWIDPANSDHMVTGCDGGINFTWDRARTWDYVNTITVSQFYEVAYDMKKPYTVCGGLQDNGSWCGPSATLHAGGITNEDWFKIFGADGFYAQFDKDDPDIVYAEGQDGNLNRRNLKTGEVRSIRPAPKDNKERYRFQWNSPLVASKHSSGTLYYGGNFLFKSTDRGDSWVRLGPDLTTGVDRNKLPIMGRAPDREMRSPSDGVGTYATLTVVSESPLTPAVLWTGSDDGNLQVSRNGGEVWKNVAGNVPGLPKDTYVSRIVASASGAGTAYAAFDGHRANDYSTYLYVTNDYGETWNKVSSGIPKETGTIHAFREHPRNHNLLFAGTEFGLYVSIDKGAKWTKLESNFPTVPVFDIAIHPRENDLILATHGRGVWIVDDITPLEQMKPATLESALHIFDVRPAVEWRISDNKGVTGNKLMKAENPPYGALIHYYLKSAVPEKDEVKATILDKSGKSIRELKGPKGAGIQTLAWDLRYEPPFTVPAEAAVGLFFFGGGPRGPLVDPGEYTVRIAAAGQVVQTKFQVEEDPRIQLLPADREERIKTLLQISELQKRTDKVRQGVVNLRTQTATMQANWKKPAGLQVPDNVKTSASALQAKADALNKNLSMGGFRENGDDPTEYVPPSVTQRLMRLMSGLDGYTTKPTGTQLEELATLSQEVGALESSWKKLSDDDVASFNKMLTSSGVSYIALAGK
jgi:Sortilin, neurotensin receptor 3,